MVHKIIFYSLISIIVISIGLAIFQTVTKEKPESIYKLTTKEKAVLTDLYEYAIINGAIHDILIIDNPEESKGNLNSIKAIGENKDIRAIQEVVDLYYNSGDRSALLEALNRVYIAKANLKVDFIHNKGTISKVNFIDEKEYYIDVFSSRLWTINKLFSSTMADILEGNNVYSNTATLIGVYERITMEYSLMLISGLPTLSDEEDVVNDSNDEAIVRLAYLYSELSTLSYYVVGSLVEGELENNLSQIESKYFGEIDSYISMNLSMYDEGVTQNLPDGFHMRSELGDFYEIEPPYLYMQNEEGEYIIAEEGKYDRDTTLFMKNEEGEYVKVSLIPEEEVN